VQTSVYDNVIVSLQDADILDSLHDFFVINGLKIKKSLRYIPIPGMRGGEKDIMKVVSFSKEEGPPERPFSLLYF